MQTGNKRGRPSRPTAEAVQVQMDGKLQQAQVLVGMNDQMAQLQAGYGEDRDLLNQLLGQAQMADAFAKFSKTVLTSKLAYVKENKLYQQLKGKTTKDGLGLSGTWAEFCNLLGFTPEHANESIANLNQFGAEALDSMSSMGIGYRELRQYRRLPEDQKQALIEVAKAGDKEGFVDLAEELIAKHAKEKEALAEQVKEAQARLDAKDRVLAENGSKINELAEQVELARRGKYEPFPLSQAKNAQEQALLTELAQATSSFYVALNRLTMAAQVALEETKSDHVQLSGRQSMEFAAQQIADSLEALCVDVDLNERITPHWFDVKALEELERRNVQENTPNGKH